MRTLGIYSVIRRKRSCCTVSSPKEQAAENLLKRNFNADTYNQKWLTDVTEFKYGADKKAYLSAILDLGDRHIVSWVLGHSNNNELVFKTFDIAVAENPDAYPIFHSDRGFQYTSPAFVSKLTDAGMMRSMSRVGKCIDNGPMEGFWGILKTEMYYLNKFDTYEDLENAITKYIYYYNYERYQEGLDCMTPIQAFMRLCFVFSSKFR
ncbi:MAG: IS3 family transposase [Candidatus Ornithomonoglobus sp.]